MKVYKFVFTVGILNLFIPFFGVPTTYKNYSFVALGVISLLYALIVRTVEKEQEDGRTAITQAQKIEFVQEDTRTIEDVVEMTEPVHQKIIVSDVTPKRRGRKPKVLVQEDIYE